jgi:flagellar motor switch protein FliN/FliY
MAAEKKQANGGSHANQGAPDASAPQSADNGNHPVGQAGQSPHAFSGLKGQAQGGKPANLDFILDIPLEITVELGRTRMLIHDLLRLGQGSVIELSKPAGNTLEILANNRLIAKGDVVVMNDKYGVRLTEVISPVERLEKLK